jgi:hypothetical protein
MTVDLMVSFYQRGMTDKGARDAAPKWRPGVLSDGVHPTDEPQADRIDGLRLIGGESG